MHLIHGAILRQRKRYKELPYTLQWQLVGDATERNHVAQALLCRTGTAIAIQRAETDGEIWHAEPNRYPRTELP